jgi:soluble lytic murein transglycosylase
MYRRVIHHRYRRKRVGILLLVLTGVVALTWFLGKMTYEYFSRKSAYDTIIREAARKYCVDSCLLKAVIWKESKFKQNARGAKGEVGLMQIRPTAAAKEWSDVNRIDIPSEGMIFYPRLNIEIGAWYLSLAMRKWEKYEHCEELALSQYNAGARGMSSWIPADYNGEVIENIKINSTKRYVTEIMEKYREYAEKRPAE